MIIDSDKCWILFDEERNEILFIFRNRDEAIEKLADFEDYASLQIANISLKDSIWSVAPLSWKALVVDLLRKANEVSIIDSPQEVELSVDEA